MSLPAALPQIHILWIITKIIHIIASSCRHLSFAHKRLVTVAIDMTTAPQPIISLAYYKQNDELCCTLLASPLWTKYGQIHALYCTYPDYLPSPRSHSHHHQTHTSIMQYKAYAYQYHTLSVHSSPLSLRMKQQKPAPTNENLVYIFTSLIHPVINYREFVRSRLLHSEYHKET